ncbi:MAG: hypothetical protein ACFFFG_06840 [Candidatus Thorarchaeota archaeon]
MPTCPNCTSLVEEGTIFCFNCGFNLLIDSYVHQTKNIASKSLDLSADVITQYHDLELKLKELTDIEVKLQDQRSYRRDLEELSQNANEHLSQLSAQRYKEFQDVKKLKEMSVTSVVARLKGDREEKLQKEELEYFTILNKEESAQVEVNRLNTLIKDTDYNITELEKLLSLKRTLQKDLEGLIHEVCAGVTDPIEDGIEADLKVLVTKTNPISLRRSAYTRARAHMQNAERNLGEALDLLGSASSLSTWDTFFGGGIFVDSMKHSRMATARNLVHSAHNDIQLANKEAPEIRASSQAFVEDISFFWDGFMDNIFSDLSSRGKIHRSISSVRDALEDSHNVIQWIDRQLNQLDNEYKALEEQIKDTRSRLLRERKRMIEDAISNAK